MFLKILLIGIAFFPSILLAQECRQTRGAIDFGSGTTKFIAAEVDICEKKIIRNVFEERHQISLNEFLERSKGQKVSLQELDAHLPKLRKSLKSLRERGVERPYVVATSVFRVAKNGREMATFLSEQLGIKVDIISQDREAELGYYSALAKIAGPEESLIVWDIGGGSMQMFAKEKDHNQIFRGDLASVSFKNKVIRDLKFSDPAKVSSPNPLGRWKGAAVQISKNHAYLNVPSYFKERLPTARVVGVGGVLSASVLKQTGKAGGFSRDELEQVLNKRANLADAQIESPYRATDITNLALVLGYMTALKISDVETVEAALGEGLIYQSLQ